MIDKYFTKTINYMRNTLDLVFLFILLIILRINNTKNLLIQKIVRALKTIFLFFRNNIKFINIAYNKIRNYSYKLIIKYVVKSAGQMVAKPIYNVKSTHPNAYYMALGSSLPFFSLFLKFATDKPLKLRKKIKSKLLIKDARENNINTENLLNLNKLNCKIRIGNIYIESNKPEKSWICVLPKAKLSQNLYLYDLRNNSKSSVTKTPMHKENSKAEQVVTLGRFTPYFKKQVGDIVNIEQEALAGLKSLRIELEDSLSKPKPMPRPNQVFYYSPHLKNHTHENLYSTNAFVNMFNVSKLSFN